MFRKRTGKKRFKRDGLLDCEEFLMYLDCRYVPHGCYAFVPTVLCSMAFWTVIVQDGCDFANLTGGNIETITGSDVIPFLEAGLSQYRAPLYYPNEGEWKMVFTETCKDYPSDLMDPFWMTAIWVSWLASVFGGAVTLFLWFTTCFTFSQRTWYFCGVEALLAATLKAGAFLFLHSGVCESSGVDDTTSCVRGFGARMDIAACVLWGVAALVVFSHYPDPKLRRISDQEMVAQVAEAENLRPKRLSTVSTTSTIPGQRISTSGGERHRRGSLAAASRGSGGEEGYMEDMTDREDFSFADENYDSQREEAYV